MNQWVTDEGFWVRGLMLVPTVILGTGSGLLGRVSPPVRLIFGLLMIVATLAVPRGSGVGIAFLVIIAGAVALVTGAPTRLVGRAIYLGALLYLPLVVILLVPAIFVGGWPPTGAPDGLALSWTATLGMVLTTAGEIALKGVATLVVAFSTLSTLRLGELHTSIAGLPLPRVARLLVLQIVHQAGLLLDETSRIRRAVVVRAPARRGIATIRLLAAMPRVWLERVGARAERSALALELRGYHLYGASPLPPPPALGWADASALAMASLTIAGAIALHYLLG